MQPFVYKKSREALKWQTALKNPSAIFDSFFLKNFAYPIFSTLMPRPPYTHTCSVRPIYILRFASEIRASSSPALLVLDTKSSSLSLVNSINSNVISFFLRIIIVITHKRIQQKILVCIFYKEFLRREKSNLCRNSLCTVKPCDTCQRAHPLPLL